MIKAMVVYDGGNITVPPSMGQAKEEQLMGTPLERLGELACRICYDSLGTGRSSEDLHKHIKEVVNLSVYEHCVITVFFGRSGGDIPAACVNRKGVYVTVNGDRYEVTANFRAILEWDRYTREVNGTRFSKMIGESLRHYGNKVAPQIIEKGSGVIVESRMKEEGLTEDQAYVSMWMRGSRGWSHEQVRHRWSMSQRSTRYVDESGSDWVLHPLLSQYLEETNDVELSEEIVYIEERCKVLYDMIVESLGWWCKEKGMEKTAARKAARGAARGYLGNALGTEMIFSAPMSGWKDMIRQRLSPMADAEIQEVYVDVVTALQGCRYADMLEKGMNNEKDDS